MKTNRKTNLTSSRLRARKSYNESADQNRPRPGEMPLKTWMHREAERIGIGVTGVFLRAKRMNWKGLGRRVISTKNIVVSESARV